jgi:DNA-binding NtrC family response regulator
VITIPIPPLRERISDLPDMIAHLMKEMVAKGDIQRVKTYSPRALQTLAAHPWPGNIRELRNVIEYSVLLSGANDEIETEFLPASLLNYSDRQKKGSRLDALLSFAISSSGARLTLREMGSLYCLVSLRQFGDEKKAADTMGLSVRTFRGRVAEAERLNLEGKPANE